MNGLNYERLNMSQTTLEPVQTPEEIQEAPRVEPFLTVTENAAKEVLRIIADYQASDPSMKLSLRIRVIGGGCSGFQNKLDLEQTINPKIDEIFEQHGVTVVVDKRSKLYLQGALVDFLEDVNRRGFQVSNPNAKTTCGCGKSYSM